MSNYKLKPGVDQAFIGGVGKVLPGRLLEGAQYAKYVPGLLVEVPDAPVQVPLESTEPVRQPQELTEPAPSPVAPVTETKVEVLTEEAEEDKKPQRPSGRPKPGPKTSG